MTNTEVYKAFMQPLLYCMYSYSNALKVCMSNSPFISPQKLQPVVCSSMQAASDLACFRDFLHCTGRSTVAGRFSSGFTIAWRLDLGE